jgi:hypothetical protein
MAISANACHNQQCAPWGRVRVTVSPSIEEREEGASATPVGEEKRWRVAHQSRRGETVPRPLRAEMKAAASGKIHCLLDPIDVQIQERGVWTDRRLNGIIIKKQKKLNMSTAVSLGCTHMLWWASLLGRHGLMSQCGISSTRPSQHTAAIR